MKEILSLVFALVVCSAPADPLPDGTEYLGHALTRVHLLNCGTNGLVVQCTANQFNAQLDWPAGAVVVLPINGGAINVGDTNLVTPDDGTELWVLNTVSSGVVSWTTPAASTPTPDHWHLYWLGFGFAFTLYGGFWLLLRLVKKTVNHGASL